MFQDCSSRYCIKVELIWVCKEKEGIKNKIKIYNGIHFVKSTKNILILYLTEEFTREEKYTVHP